MNFSEFCLKNVPQKKERGLTMADLGGEKKSARPIYEREVARLRSLITEFPIENDVFFNKISIREEAIKKGDYCPDDEAYLLGRSKRGVWVVCDDCDIYVVARTRKFEQAARIVASNIARAADKVFGPNYSVTGCWAM